jgi:hypothetical protein
MSKMSQLHASMSDSWSMGANEERERVLAIIDLGISVSDIAGSVEALKMCRRLVESGVAVKVGEGE